MAAPSCLGDVWPDDENTHANDEECRPNAVGATVSPSTR